MKKFKKINDLSLESSKGIIGGENSNGCDCFCPCYKFPCGCAPEEGGPGADAGMTWTLHNSFNGNNPKD